MSVQRIYVEKKWNFAVKARELKKELTGYLGILAVDEVRILNRYDIEGLSPDTYRAALGTIFSEPPLDEVYEERFPLTGDGFVFTVEYLPGQFDQRADSAKQCVMLLKGGGEPVIRSAVTYVISGILTEAQKTQIRAYCVNPVDSRIAEEDKPSTLAAEFERPAKVERLDGFCGLSEGKLRSLYDSLRLAMIFEDFLHVRNYFKNEEARDPSMTEIRLLDTYWSDHCRHTTFQTELTEIKFAEGDYKKPLEETYGQYLADRKMVWGEENEHRVCLMDLALMAMRKLKLMGGLEDLEESEEINACSIVVPADIDGKREEWLVNFKNETHNHPTEIEPFGGAATCLGGAIRDPLSGRTYVYQAMRITGAADPTGPLNQTLKGKLPQRKLVTKAAAGYSSYGNQIGLATGYVKELYHPGYEAKRMEIGAVLGAAPKKNVSRRSAAPGDLILLLGGRTGRDGCGGATGSSKVHTEESIEICGAEVQKGNPPTQRKIQRLFRREELSRMIKKCNDFGAGGISVAIGELAAGIFIDLDKVPKKYEGLSGTELAISESQERMAVVIDPGDAKRFFACAEEENLEAAAVAVVTEEPRLIMSFRGKAIVDISRAFLDTNGARQTAGVLVKPPHRAGRPFEKRETKDVRQEWLSLLSGLNACSQKGLVELFDSSVGAGSVFMPYGGRYQLTETQSMVAKLPVLSGETDTVTMMSYGFDPGLSQWSPYHGAVYAVLSSVAKIVAAGGDYRSIRFTFQEYFRRMTKEAAGWSEPFSALLGAYAAQLGLGLPSIGGKDSMSGTFEDKSVPPTLVSFAVDTGSLSHVITPELKLAGSRLFVFSVKRDEYDLPVYEQLKEGYGKLYEDITEGRIISAYAVEGGGLSEAVAKMAFGNKLGVRIGHFSDPGDFFAPGWGSIVCEVPEGKLESLSVSGTVIGEVTGEDCLEYGSCSIPMEEAIQAWSGTLEGVFPTKTEGVPAPVAQRVFHGGGSYICRNRIARPRVFIPVFPGTNCEYDSARAFEEAGAEVSTQVFCNLRSDSIRESLELFKKEIGRAQIVLFPGGFSAGDEPDGSAKFFSAVFRNEGLSMELMRLLKERDGLLLGICNGFQALIKLGLLPEGRIAPQKADSPTLAINAIGRHVSKMVRTKVVSDKSPWLMKARLGGIYVNPVSHGEGRFVAEAGWLKRLEENGQIATQYVDGEGRPSMDGDWNPNGSCMAIEGILSPDGRIFGKMAHSERRGKGVAINITGEQDMGLFQSGVEYFR